MPDYVAPKRFSGALKNFSWAMKNFLVAEGFLWEWRFGGTKDYCGMLKIFSGALF